MAGPVVSVDLVEDDSPCMVCGYNLHGLPASGVCPECGGEVTRSLHGNRLDFASAGYVRRLHEGSFLVEIALALTLPYCLLFPMTEGVAADASRMGISIVALSGWWLLSAPDPAFVGHDEGVGARKVLRAAVAVEVWAVVMATVLAAAGHPARVRELAADGPLELARADPASAAATALTGLYWLTCIVRFFASLTYIRVLAGRIRSEKIDTQARTLRWSLPALVGVLLVGALATAALGGLACIFILVIGVSGFVWVAMYVDMIDSLRQELRDVRARIGFRDRSATEGEVRR